MDLINDRYKVMKLLNKDDFEDYLVTDSLDNNVKYLRIIDGNKHRELIKFYIDEFLWVKNIKHKRILDVETFGIVKTINLKPNDLPIYYVISEIHPKVTLNDIYSNLNFIERIKTIQEIIYVIDYLHFRGFIYKFLDPKKIYYSKDDGIQLLNLNSIIEYSFSKKIESFNEGFVTSSVLLRNNKVDATSDYYSIGMVMKYILMENYLDDDSFIFMEDFNIGNEDKLLLKDIIEKLINASKDKEDISLINIIKNLDSLSDEQFKYNFSEDREHLYLKTKLVGRNSELEHIRQIDEKIINNDLDYNGLIINGITGVGKTRLVKEIAFRLRIKRRTVYSVNVDQSLSFELDIIRIFLNIITDNINDRILYKYRNSFFEFIPEKYGNYIYSTNNKNIQKVELYKLFNNICNYLKEISSSNPIYIIIDNINRYNETFIHLVDYLLQSLFNSMVFLIFTYDGINEKKSLNYNVEKWIEEGYIKQIVLNNLTKDDIPFLTQNILGMSFPPERLASVLYEASKGNPRFLDLAIKEIYSKKELFIADNGKWYSDKDNYTELSIPTDFRKTIIKQTKNITGDRLRVLKIISISNESMPKFLIYNMLDFDMVKLNNIVNSLLNEQILVERNYNKNFYYGFLSNELKATVYYDMYEGERLRLHKELADLLIYYKPNIIRDLTEEIIYNLIRANEKNEAVDLIVKEAGNIENIYNKKAISLWEMAFSIVKNIEHEKKIYILEILTKINLHKSNVEKLKLYLDEFTVAAKKSNIVEYIIRAYNYQGEIYLRNNEIDKLNKIVKDINKLSLEKNYQDGFILAYILKIRLLNKDTEVNRAYVKEMLDKALDLSNKNKIIKYLGQIYFHYGLFNYINGNFNIAIEYYKESIKYLEDNGEIYDTIKAINNLGNVCLEQTSSIDKCFDYFHQGLEITNKYEFTHLETIFLHNIGDIYLDMLELVKAKNYIERAIQLANINKDMSMIFMSNCNLGRIHLLTNEYDKAYKTYVLLRSMVEKEQITDTEIIMAYRNFLGFFYFVFGNFELSLEYSKLASEISYNFSESDYFMSTFRVFHIDYLNNSIDYNNFFSFLEEYNSEVIDELYNWKLLTLTVSALLRDDLEFVKNIMTNYYKLSDENDSQALTWSAEIINLCRDFNEDNLLIIEKKIIEKEKKENYKINFRLYVLLARKYSKNNDYKKALKYNIKAFDCINNSIYSIDDNNIKGIFISTYEIQEIKAKIYDILKKYYNVKVNLVGNTDIDDDNFQSYFDLNPIINCLNNEEINDIIGYQEDGVNSMEELIYHLDSNYLNNIQSILKYLGKATLAKRGFILSANNGIINLEEPLVSLVEDDKNLPNEMLLFQALRQENGFLFNLNISRPNRHKYYLHLPEKARGVICIPILSEYYNDSQELGTYYNGKVENIYGYIYLETDNGLNRFDEEGVKLGLTLSKLISLNLENEKLRLYSTTDKMTSVYTRKYFETKLDSLLELYKIKQGQLSVLMIDIDRFKYFNDKYGHLKGDEILGKVGHNIKKTVGSNGIAGRYGGEEFIVLLWDCNLDDAIVIGEDIRKNIEITRVPGVEDTITASIGLAQFPTHGNYKIDLINSADQALYYAKEILLRNSIAVWHKDLQKTNPNIDKAKGIVTGNLAKDNRNILQLIDISESINENTNIKGKIYQFLSSVITIANCEYATFIEYNNGKIGKYYTRRREDIEWVEIGIQHMNLINEVYNSKMGLFTIDLYGESKDYLHVSDWRSVLVSPVIKQDIVKGIIYITAPLKEREFSQETMNLINLFSNIFSGNY